MDKERTNTKYSLISRLSWGRGKESLVTTACTCVNYTVKYSIPQSSDVNNKRKKVIWRRYPRTSGRGHVHVYPRKRVRILWLQYPAMVNFSKCRICSSVVGRSHCISPFSQEMTKCDQASRMSKILEVPISQEDNLSHYVWRSCKGDLLPWKLGWKVYAPLPSLLIRHNPVQI